MTILGSRLLLSVSSVARRDFTQRSLSPSVTSV
jgi:hypothetical protein